jgi:hypothetical protein
VRPIDGRIIASIGTPPKRGEAGSSRSTKGEKRSRLGSVLAIYRVVAPFEDPRPNTAPEQIYGDRGEPTRWFQPERFLQVPDERGTPLRLSGFRSVSYAILLNTTDPVFVGDYVRNP